MCKALRKVLGISKHDVSDNDEGGDEKRSNKK